MSSRNDKTKIPEIWRMPLNNWKSLSIESASVMLKFAEQQLDQRINMDNLITARGYGLLVILLSFISLFVSIGSGSSGFICLPLIFKILFLVFFIAAFTFLVLLIRPRYIGIAGRNPKNLDGVLQKMVDLGNDDKGNDLSHLSLLQSQIENIQYQITFIDSRSETRIKYFILALFFITGMILELLYCCLFSSSLVAGAGCGLFSGLVV